jgi:hypothetical protein
MGVNLCVPVDLYSFVGEFFAFVSTQNFSCESLHTDQDAGFRHPRTKLNAGSSDSADGRAWIQKT